MEISHSYFEFTSIHANFLHRDATIRIEVSHSYIEMLHSNKKLSHSYIEMSHSYIEKAQCYTPHSCIEVQVRTKAKIRNRCNQVPHLTQDTICESDKNTRKQNTQDSQGASPFPVGDHNAAKNRQDSMTKVNTKHKSTKEASPWNSQ